MLINNFRGASYPSLIIEISYTQERKALRKLEEEYIPYSNGDIETATGLDVDYSNYSKEVGKKARISVWEPNYTHTHKKKREGKDIDPYCQREHSIRSEFAVGLKEQLNLTRSSSSETLKAKHQPREEARVPP
jgi:hypothetical protein